MIQKNRRGSRVFCEDQINSLQHLNGPECHVRQISYGGGNDIKHRMMCRMNASVHDCDFEVLHHLIGEQLLGS